MSFGVLWDDVERDKSRGIIVVGLLTWAPALVDWEAFRVNFLRFFTNDFPNESAAYR